MVLCIILKLEPLIRFKRGQQTTTFWIFQCKLRKCPLALWNRGSVNRKRSQTLHPIHSPITETLLRSQTVNHVWWFVINYAVKNSRSWRAHAYIPSYQLLSDTRFQFVTLLVQLSLACLLPIMFAHCFCVTHYGWLYKATIATERMLVIKRNEPSVQANELMVVIKM